MQEFAPKTYSKNQQVVQLEKGRVPPQAIDLEEAVLGALMIDNAAVNDVIDILEPKCFYKESHSQTIRVAM